MNFGNSFSFWQDGTVKNLEAGGEHANLECNNLQVDNNVIVAGSLSCHKLTETNPTYDFYTQAQSYLTKTGSAWNDGGGGAL